MRSLGEIASTHVRAPTGQMAENAPDASDAAGSSSPPVYGVRGWVETAAPLSWWRRWTRNAPAARRAMLREASHSGVEILCNGPFPVGRAIRLCLNGGNPSVSAVVSACERGGCGRMFWKVRLTVANPAQHVAGQDA